MKQNAYITGKSLVCALGDTPHQITSNMHTLNQKNYSSFLKNQFNHTPFYSIKSFNEEPTQRFFSILTHVIDQAIKETNLSPQDQEELHIFIGSTSMGISMDEQHNKAFEQAQQGSELAHIGYGYIGTFVQNHLNTNTKATIFSTACTSSINALSHAAKQIEYGKIKRAIVVGIELFNASTYKGFSSLMLLSQNQTYTPFDAKSDGIILGEACSAVILESTQKKTSDFKYLASSNICDNYSETTSNPTGEPIFECLKQSIQKANLCLEDIDLIKAHATGSENNNDSEANALSLLFDYYGQNCFITALKPYLGHTLGGCGTNELVLLLYAIEKEFFPATLGFNTPASNVQFIPLPQHHSCKKKVTILLNFVAFGGNNSSIILSNKE